MSESSPLVESETTSSASRCQSPNRSTSVFQKNSAVIAEGATDQSYEHVGEDADAAQETPPIWRNWWKEGLCFLLATATLIAIFVLLRSTDGMLLRGWHFRVSLNTMVAILAQIAASALLYVVSGSIGQLKWVMCKRGERALISLEALDKASRGSAGSVGVAFGTIGFRHPAVLGAWATILMLGLPPFAQQAVRIVDHKWVNAAQLEAYSEITAKIPRAIKASDGNGTRYHYGPNWVNSAFQFAIYEGFTPKAITSSQVAAECSASNCTWAPYHNMGVYASTENVTESLIKECDPWQGRTDMTNCTWTLRDAVFHTQPDTAFDIVTRDPPRPMMTFTNSTNDLWVAVNQTINQHDLKGIFNGSVPSNEVSNINATFAEIYVLYRYKDAEPNAGNVTTQSSPTAYKVTMGFCIQLLQTTSTNGTTNTTVLSQDNFPSWQHDYAAQDGQQNNSTLGLWTTIGNANFSVPYNNLDASGQGMAVLFTGNATVPPELSKPDLLEYQSSQMMAMIANDVFGNVSVAVRFNKIAQSLTNAMRTIGSAYDGDTSKTTLAHGTAWVPQSYIAVNPLWMIGPMILWLFATVEWVLAIWLTRRSGAPIWKSSLLAVLESQRRVPRLATVKAMKAAADTQVTELIPHGRSWKLRQGNDASLVEDGEKP